MPLPDDPVVPGLPPVAPLPLTGLRVLDLTLARAGPTCVRHLADWGADIIRVEAPGSNEGFGGARDGFDFVNLHRKKRSLALDLKDPDGHAAFLALAKDRRRSRREHARAGQAPPEDRRRGPLPAQPEAGLRVHLR